ESDAATLDPMQATKRRSTEFDGVVDDGVEDRLQDDWRVADHPQDICRRRLLLQRLSKLGRASLLCLEQPRVLNGDHRLVGKSFKKSDLFIGKWRHLCANNEYCSKSILVPKQWSG